MVDIATLTKEQKQAICIAYLAEGNSISALCMLIIELSSKKEDADNAVEEFFDDIVTNLKELRESADPGDFETPLEEELNALLALAKDNEYESGHSW